MLFYEELTATNESNKIEFNTLYNFSFNIENIDVVVSNENLTKK